MGSDLKKESLKLHKELKGKLEIVSKRKVTKENLPLLYTPGVAASCMEIYHDRVKEYEYTGKQNTIAIVTDGSAVLGLGKIGPQAAMPVMEGKAILFKEFGGVNAIPICLDTYDTEEIIQTTKHIAPSFGGINLEDISSPRCFDIEKKLDEELDIPVFHDDQHGTAVVVYAGVINALKLVNKTSDRIKVVINGAGAAGIAIAEFLLKNKFNDIILCDSKGIVHHRRKEGMNQVKEKIARITNPRGQTGSLADALGGCELFIGVSVRDILSEEMISSMAKDPVLFTLANPDPEISPERAKKAGVKVIATGRSDYPNQVNNLLAFPGIFKGALGVRAGRITFEMKREASLAIASLVKRNDLKPGYFIPHATDRTVAEVVSDAVRFAYKKYGA
ncbi:MAG: NADP-dependent malic enzyme [Spirochaetes bacterium]|nr:NADP-dependent malic enzyme [Spirochaetota bacterium]